MEIISIISGMIVGVLNVFLNIYVQKSSNNGTFIESFFSINFLIAFIIGVASITAMLTFYTSTIKINLGQALMLMASSSLIFGVLINWLYFKKNIELIDWGIFVILIFSYFLKFTKTLN
jgi:hypothetical protein